MNTFEKIGDYKKVMKLFVKGMIKTKLFGNAKNEVVIVIDKVVDDEKNRFVSLTISNTDKTISGVFKAQVATRVYNKVDPSLFKVLQSQFAKAKNPITIVIK